MRPTILLRGARDDADSVYLFANDEARSARMTTGAASRYAERVRIAYLEACHALICRSDNAADRPVMRLTLDSETLAPRFALVESDGAPVRAAPRVHRALRAQAWLRARAARREDQPG